MDKNQEHEIYLSMVAPAFNEADNLPVFVGECTKAGEALGEVYEIIISNDASNDSTSAVLEELMNQHRSLRVLDMNKRSGQAAALDAALRAARGRYIATLDADLQNDPGDIPRLLEPVVKGECDYVNGWRNKRQDSFFRCFVSRYGNAFRNYVTMEKVRDSGCGLKVFRRECIDRMKMFDGGHRFFATLVRMDGWRVTEMEVNHRPRTAGKTKYGFMNRFFKVLRDAFAVRWMHRKTIAWRAVERTRGKG